MGTAAYFQSGSESRYNASLLDQHLRKEERADRRAEAVKQMTDAMVAEEMHKNPSEYLFGGYFDEGNLTTEEREVLNTALCNGDPNLMLMAFEILRRHVCAEMADTMHRKAERAVDDIAEF